MKLQKFPTDPKLKDRQAFTVEYGQKVSSLPINIKISEPLGDSQNITEMTDVKAILDTGATTSCVSTDIVKKLSLSKIDIRPTHTVNGVRKAMFVNDKPKKVEGRKSKTAK